MTKPIKIGETKCEFLVETPSSPTTTAAIFLPGMSGGAFSERFQPVVDVCLNSGFAIALVSAWKNTEDVEQKSFAEIHKAVGEVATYLHLQGYTQIYGIGKSFGGALMLTFPSIHINKRVLWAPAIGVIESGSNIESYMDAKLGTVSSLLDMQIDRKFLEQINTPTLLIHGTADDNIPFSNSEMIVSMLSNAKLMPITGADHSYKNKEHEAAVIKATIDFLVS